MVIAVVLSVLACSPEEDTSRSTATLGIGGCPGVAGQTIRWIVPFSAGGGYDVYSRLIEPFYEEAIGAEIVVENRIGAGGRVGARAVRDAEPNGLTLGLLNAYSLLVWELSSNTATGLHPLEDFTPIGRLTSAYPIWLTAAGSPFQTLEDLLTGRGEDPILVGISEVGSTAFLSVSVAATLLDIDVAYIAGYPGSRESSMGLIRGEFDLMGVTYESILDRVEAGDLIPIVQISDTPLSSHPSLAGVPLLGGPDGVVALRARARGEDLEESLALADGLSSLFAVGRMVSAPPGLDRELAECLSDRLGEVTRDSAFIAAASRAGRQVSYQGKDAIIATLESTREAREPLAPILRRHAELVRSGASGR